MTEIGDPSWVAQQGRRLEALAVDLSLRLVVQQVITGPNPSTWHVVIHAGHVTVTAGAHDSPGVTLTTDRNTASAIAEGRSSAQREFLDGRLRVGGDITLLLTAREALTF